MALQRFRTADELSNYIEELEKRVIVLETNNQEIKKCARALSK